MSIILLIDDNPTVRRLVRVMLLGNGYELIETDSGDQGLDMLESRRVDLVIADFNMPRMDGIAFVKALRAHPRGEVRSVPVILLSGDRREDLAAQGLAAGANSFLAKSAAESSKLKATIAKLISTAS